MSIAQPVAKLAPASGADRFLLHVGLEVFGADPARVKLGEKAHEALNVCLFRGRGCGRVCGGDGV
jgi:hypothetical protein